MCPDLRPRQLPPVRRRPEHGFAFLAAIFLLVVLGAFTAFCVTITSNAAATGSLAFRGVQAFESATAGLEWAAYETLDPRQAIWGSITTPPSCFTTPSTVALPAAMGGFTVSVTCTRYPASGANPAYYEEGSNRLAVYVFTSNASLGTPGSATYVERQLSSRVVVCKNPYASGPAYAC